MKKGRFWLGLGISVLALFLAFRQVDLDKVMAAFVEADYFLVVTAAGIQLLVLAVIASRWGLLFGTRPRFFRLFNAILIAQLANSVIPFRVGVFIRAYLIGKSENQSKIMVLTTIVPEKVFDILVLLLLVSMLIPFYTLQWSGLLPIAGLFVVLFPALVLVTYQRRRVLQVVRGLLQRFSWAERFGLVQKFEAGLEGLGRLRERRTTALLWAWTLIIAGMGILVNYVVLRALAIQTPFLAAAVLLVVLKFGRTILPATPLGGIGVSQYLSMEVLSLLFEVEKDLAITYSLLHHFVVFVPGAVLGALALYRTHYSLRQLKEEAGE